MLADDFVGGVPLGALSARIPACDVPFLIEHVDRVVDNGLNEPLVKRGIDFGRCLRFRGKMTDPALFGGSA